jgi:hypothetical protein
MRPTLLVLVLPFFVLAGHAAAQTPAVTERHDLPADSASPRAPCARVGLLGAAALLASPDVGAGVALDLGARVEIRGRYVIGLDLGYGVLGASRATEDRWWILASYGWLAPLGGGTVLELGGAVGAGAASGYRGLDHFVAAPFDPDWGYQLVPALTARTRLWFSVDAHLDAFVGVELGSLLPVPGVGVREGNATTTGDPLWGTLSVGTAVWP